MIAALGCLSVAFVGVSAAADDGSETGETPEASTVEGDASVAQVDSLPAPVLAFQGLIDEMQVAAAAMVDATYTFHKVELVGGNLQPAEQTAVKYRAPNDFYMKWIGEVGTGQELLFQPGWNDDRMRISPGPLVPTVNLSVDSRLASRTNRHTVRHAPLPTIVQNFVNDEAALVAAAEIPSIQELGARMVYGDSCRCFQLEMPKEKLPELYASRIEICISDRTHLPARIQAWDVEGGMLQLVEDYGYEEMHVNVGLTDADFDPENKAYNF